jgi:hypothetical protein
MTHKTNEVLRYLAPMACGENERQELVRRNNLQYHKLVGNQANMVVPPRINAMLTGARVILQNKEGMARIVYEDDSEEFADCSDFDIADKENYLELVGIIQERARK